MAILKQGSTTLNAGAKGDMPSFTINSTPVVDGSEIVISGGTGTSGLDIFVPTLADFNSPTGKGDRIWRIETNISLDANVDFTGVKGIIFQDGGGVVDVNQKTIKFDEASFEFDTDRMVFDFSAYTTKTETFTATEGQSIFSLPTDELYWRIQYGLTINGVPVSTRFYEVHRLEVGFMLTDRLNLAKYIANIAPISAGDTIVITYVPILPDHYSYIDIDSTFKGSPRISVRNFGGVSEAEDNTFDNRNVILSITDVIGYNGGDLFVSADTFQTTVVQSYEFARPQRSDFTLANGANIIGVSAGLEGQEKGVSKIKIFNSTYTYGWILFVMDYSPFSKIDKVYFLGDTKERQLLGEESEPQTLLRAGNLSEHYEITNCVLDGASDGFNCLYSTDFGGAFFNLESGTLDDTGLSVIDATKMRSSLTGLSSASVENKYFCITADSYGWYKDIASYFVDIFFYDSENTYIDHTRSSSMYKRIFYPEGTVSIRVVFDYGGTFPTVFQARSPNMSMYGKITNNRIINNYRNGLSNLDPGTRLLNNYIAFNGGIPIGPGYGLDQEDGAQLLADVTISGNTFEYNHAGAITVPAQKDVLISENTFNGNPSSWNSQSHINMSTAWDVAFIGNKVFSTKVEFSKKANIYNNTFYNCDLRLRNQNNKLSNNEMENCVISGGDTSSRQEFISYGGSYISDNTMVITKPIISAGTLHKGELVTSNYEVYFRNGLTFADGGAFNDNSIKTYTDLVERKIDKMRIHFEPNVIQTTLTPVHPNDISNSVFPFPIMVWAGQRRNSTYTNNKLKGGFEWGLTLTPYTTDGTDLKDFTFNGGILVSSSDYSLDVLKSGDNIGVNIYFNDYTIDVTNRADFDVLFEHAGELVFTNCTFKADSALSFSMATSTCQAATFKDCTWINVTPTYRTGDIVITTPTNEVVQ